MLFPNNPLYIFHETLLNCAMPLKKLLPESSSQISGLIGAYQNDIKFNIECNSDVYFCDKLFLHTMSTANHWGIKNQNDWVKLTFNKSLLYITHYSIQTSNYANKPKGVLVEGTKENGMHEIIDTNSETGLTSTYAVLTKEVDKAGPYKSIKFSVFDRYSTDTTWYSSLFGIDVFGILAPKVRYTCNQKQRRKIMDNDLLIFVLLVFS